MREEKERRKKEKVNLRERDLGQKMGVCISNLYLFIFHLSLLGFCIFEKYIGLTQPNTQYNSTIGPNPLLIQRKKSKILNFKFEPIALPKQNN